MIDELLKVGGTKLLVPCVLAVMLVALAKGLFGVHQSKRATRKDFLDLWSHRDDRDELWQQTAIRHLFGEWLPTPIIHLLMKSSQSGRALAEVCNAWNLLEIDDETSVVNWKSTRHRERARRKREIRLYMALYWLLAMAGILIAFYAFISTQGGLAAIVRWVLAIELAVFAVHCLIRSENLKAAHEAIPRWLNLP